MSDEKISTPEKAEVEWTLRADGIAASTLNEFCIALNSYSHKVVRDRLNLPCCELRVLADVVEMKSQFPDSQRTDKSIEMSSTLTLEVSSSFLPLLAPRVAALTVHGIRLLTRLR